MSARWGIVRGKGLDMGGYFAKVSCRHHKGGGFGACGSCYARLYFALDAIRQGEDGLKVATEVHDLMAREGRS